jgi:thiol-disulfide isomerase/thioredoxin
MRKSVRFAATSLSFLFFTSAVLAADLREIRNPAGIASVFPAKAAVRLLNVWATWCVPCVEEMPDLKAIDQAFGNELAIAGVSLDYMVPEAKKETVVSFLDRLNITFPNVYYTGKPDDLADLLRFNGEIPVTIIFDRNGKELWRHQGRLNKEKTIAEIRILLRRTR